MKVEVKNDTNDKPFKVGAVAKLKSDATLVLISEGKPDNEYCFCGVVLNDSENDYRTGHYATDWDVRLFDVIYNANTITIHI